MSDTLLATPLRASRDKLGLSRERVAAQLDPPISSKTLERWERSGTVVKEWRLKQLAALYGVALQRLKPVATLTQSKPPTNGRRKAAA